MSDPITEPLKILIADVTAKLYGYQVSARLASNELNGQAGVLTALVTQYWPLPAQYWMYTS